jgi:OOP family OmpA-OmpF porin
MEQSVKAGITTAVAAGLALASVPASAAEWYGGLAYGETNVEVESDGADFEADDSAFKVFGGFMFNEFFGVEVSYLDLGDLSDGVGFDGGEFGDSFINVDAEITGFAGELVGQYPVGPVDLFAKAGLIAWDVEGDITGFDGDTNESFSISADDDGEDLIWGVGARYNAGQFAVRAEYESIDAGDIDELTVMSIGVEYRFEI